MRDDDRVHGILNRELRIADATARIRRVRAAKHVTAGVNGPQPAKHLLEPVRQRVVGRVHAGKLGVTALFRNVDGIQQRPHGRHVVV